MNEIKKYLILAGLMILTLVGCDTNEVDRNGNDSDREVSVVVSFYPMYEFANQIGGDRAEVSLMVSGGADPHSYEPSAQDIGLVSDADLFIYSSNEMEFWAGSLLNAIENDGLVVVQAIDGIDDFHVEHDGDSPIVEDVGAPDPYSENLSTNIDIMGLAGHYHTGDQITLLAQHEEAEEWIWVIRFAGEEWEVVEDLTDNRFEYEANNEFHVQGIALDADGNEIDATEVIPVHIDDHDNLDPHIWLDPVFAQDQVQVILEAFIEADPEGEEIYTQNADLFVEELQALDEAFIEAFEDAENRLFVVQHEAFGHLANRYNLEQLAIGGLSTEIEPSPSRIADIGQLVEQYNVPVIYYQHGANSAVAQTVADETDTETAVLHDLETLSEELRENDLGYLDAMYENLESLKLSIN